LVGFWLKSWANSSSFCFFLTKTLNRHDLQGLFHTQRTIIYHIICIYQEMMEWMSSKLIGLVADGWWDFG
jgi:hypothetical protein